MVSRKGRLHMKNLASWAFLLAVALLRLAGLILFGMGIIFLLGEETNPTLLLMALNKLVLGPLCFLVGGIMIKGKIKWPRALRWEQRRVRCTRRLAYLESKINPFLIKSSIDKFSTSKCSKTFSISFLV